MNTKNYEAPAIEIIEIEIEDAVLAGSTTIEGTKSTYGGTY